MEEISIKDLLGILRRRLLFIILIPLLVTVAAGAYLFTTYVPVYTAQAKLYILLDYTDSTGTIRYDVSTSTSFANDYKELIQMPEVLAETASRLGMSELPEDLEINVAAVSNTRILNVDVTSITPELSMNVANTISGVFCEYVSSLTKSDSISVASDAQLPIEPSNASNPIKYTAFACLGTLALVIFAVLALAMMNTRVTSDMDIETQLDLGVLARVTGYQKEMEAYRKQRGPEKKTLYESVSERTRENIKTLSLNMQFAAMGKELRRLVVTSTIPSEGKTSMGIMLATQLGMEGKRVCMVDMDFRAPKLGKYLGRRGSRDLLDCLTGRAALDEVIIPTPMANVYFVDNYHHTTIASRMDQSPEFAKFTDALLERFDVLMFDTAPIGMFIDAASLAAKADGVIYVCAENHVEIGHMREAVEQLRKVNANILGVAFNFIQHSKNSYGYYGGRYNRYNRYERYKDKTDKDVRA